MTNTHKFPKFIAIASRDKMWEFIALDNTTEKLANAEGSRRGFKEDDTECVFIAKRVREEDGVQVYKANLIIYRDGIVYDTSTESCNEWRVCDYYDISFE